MRIGATGITVRNSIFTGGTADGIKLLSTGSATIDNCTIVGDTAAGSGVTDTVGSSVTVRNTISVHHSAGKDFNLTGTISYFGYNMFTATLVTGFDPSTCGNCAGNNKSPPGSLDSLFISPSTDDYHLELTGHTVGNTGTDLSSTFTDDVDGGFRTVTWDMGADEAVSGTTPTTGGSTRRIASWREVAP